MENQKEKSAFTKDTQHRLATELARFWVIENVQRTGNIPDEKLVMFAYANGPVSFDWGNPAGPENPEIQPLRRKRVRITLEIEDG